MSSKRSLLAALLMAIAPAAVHAQFGLRGGVNLTKFVGGDASNVEARRGINLGMTVPLLRLGPISLVPEVYYSQKGAKQTSLFGTGADAFALEVDYIEVPLLAKLSIPLTRSRAFSVYLAGGPAYAWNVKCSFSSLAAAGGVQAETENECGETFGSFDTAMEKADRGIVFSGGLDFTVPGLGGLNLDARLVRGLARLREGDTASDVKNQAFSLMLGYYLGR